MKKQFCLFVTMFVFALVAKAQYQYPNSDFESEFVKAYASSSIFSSSTYYEPEGWHGYATISGTVGSLGRSGSKLVASDDVHEGSTGSQSVYVAATSIMGVIANGVMTNGQIYSGSLTATDGSGNYNFSDQTNTGNTNTYYDNSQFYTSFTGRPDYMNVWLKFVPAAEGKGNARVSVYLHKDGTVMYDPTDNVEDMSIVVAHAEESIPTNEGAWTQYSIPFDYDGKGQYDGTATPALILATFSTNETPGKGASGDSLYIDDIEMVYLSELQSANYDGEAITFTDGAASVDAEYDATLLECVANGVGASIELDEPTEDNGYTLTITVKGDNISVDASNYHTYTVQFSAPEEEEVKAIVYTDELVVTVNGETLDPIETSVTVEYPEDGSINFVLNNFVLDMEGTSLAVGNIEVDGIELKAAAEGEEYQTFSFDGTIKITRGDLEGVTMWWGPMLGDVPVVMEGKITDEKLYVTISISLSTLSMDIEVVFGSDFESEEEPGVEPDLTLYATYDGVELTDGAVIEGAYDASKLEVTAGEGATVATEYDDETLTLTITVTAEDGSESKTYTVTFTGEEEEEMKAIVYTDELVVTVNGETLDPIETSVTVEYPEDGSINFVLNNFVLDMDGTSLAVGNIEVDGIELKAAAEGVEYQTFSFDGTIKITRGDLEGVTMWWGPMLGDVPVVMEGKITDEKLYVTISISLSTLSMDIEVVFGSDFESEEEPGVEPDLTLYATYDGVELADGAVIDGAYDASKLEVNAGEGATVATEYDEETLTLTITVTAEDGSESKTYTVTFTGEEEPEVEPDLTLYATYDGVELADGAVIEGAYDASKLDVTAGEGATVATEYDDETLTLTITVTAEDGSESKTYTITFTGDEEPEVEPDLTLYATYDGVELTDGAVIEGAYDASKLDVTAGEGATVATEYDDEALTLTITVTAEDGSESKTYTVTFTIPTGINAVTSATEGERVYDLMGRPVSGTLLKGIYVKKGKKVFVK